MLNHLVARWLVCLALLPCAAWAAVSVTEVTVSGTGAPYDVAYVLNTDASSGFIDILNAGSQVVRTLSLSGAALSKGAHVVSWDGKDSSNMPVSGGQYTARVSASGAAVPAGGQVIWGPVDSDPDASLPSEYGHCTNRNAGSPYYGRIYSTSYSNDTVFVFRADGSSLFGISYQNFSDPNDPLQALGAGTRGPFIGPDDRLYVGTQQDSSVARAQTPHYYSMTQTGTDVQLIFDSADQQRAVYVTGTGSNRRIYYSRAPSRATATTPGGEVHVRTEDGTDTVILDGSVDPVGFAGNPDGIVVVDSNTDPSGHANNTTIYVRFIQAGTSGESNVGKFDNGSSNPAQATYVRDAGFDASAALPALSGGGPNGRGLALAVDGNLWACVAGPDVATRGYVKLNKTSGAQLDKITVPSGQGKPQFVACDNAGNVIGLQTPETSTSPRAKYLSMFAPQGAASTNSATSPAFTVSGTVLTPILVTAGPTASPNAATAVITWTTDVASSSDVSYGTSSTSLSSSASGAGSTKNHSVVISGLTKQTPYFFQVRSAATGYASYQSDVLTFTTKDTVALSAVSATATQTTATVTWTTDKAAGSEVRYGVTPDALNQTATGADNVTEHSVSLTGLVPGKTYYYVAVSGSATVETTLSAEYAFSTLNASGFKVRSLSAFGDFKFGLFEDTLVNGNAIALNTSALPGAVDDAGVPDLPVGRHGHATVAYGGYLYVLGGRAGSPSSTVYFAPIQSDGKVGAWALTSPLPETLVYLQRAGFGYNGYVYIVGGASAPPAGGITPELKTYVAKQNPLDGTLGPWSVAGSFPDPNGDGSGGRDLGSVAVVNGRVYFVGGEDTTRTARQETMFADIKTDGTLGTWTVASELLPSATKAGGAAAHAGKLYEWCGTSNNANALSDNNAAAIQASGQIGPWNSNGSPVSFPRYAFAGTILHGNALMIGGADDNGLSNVVSYAPVNADGTLGDFLDVPFNYELPGATPMPLRDIDGAAWQGRYYLCGGRTTNGSADIDSNAVSLATAITFASSSTYVSKGRYESPIIDLGKAEALQSFVVTASGSGVTLSLRTAGADGVFSSWATQSGLSITFPTATSARFVQFALDLASGGSSTPSVSSVTLTYGTAVLPLSRADAVTALKIAAGIQAAQPSDMDRLDVVADNTINVADATKILRTVQ